MKEILRHGLAFGISVLSPYLYPKRCFKMILGARGVNFLQFLDLDFIYPFHNFRAKGTFSIPGNRNGSFWKNFATKRMTIGDIFFLNQANQLLIHHCDRKLSILCLLHSPLSKKTSTHMNTHHTYVVHSLTHVLIIAINFLNGFHSSRCFSFNLQNIQLALYLN